MRQNIHNTLVHLAHSLRDFFKEKPLIGIVSLMGVGVVSFVFWPSKKVPPPPSLPAKAPTVPMASLKTLVDPRDIWAEKIGGNMEKLEEKMDTNKKFQEKHAQNLQDLQETIKLLQKKLQFSPSTPPTSPYPAPPVSSSWRPPSQTDRMIQTSAHTKDHQEKGPLKKDPWKLISLHQEQPLHPRQKNPSNYVTSGSFVRSVLLTGVVAETGTESASSPQPILLRAVDKSIFSKGHHTPPMKEAVLVGSCYGNISSERTLCRLESLSLMNHKNEIIERPVEGWIIGEDGRPGMKGTVVDKSSDMARAAMLSGFLGGISNFFQSQSSRPLSLITAPSSSQNSTAEGLSLAQTLIKGKESLRDGVASGASSALDKIADYSIKRAEQMNPVVVVASGRTVDVVFKKGFFIENDPPPPLDSSQNSSVGQSSPQETRAENSANPSHYPPGSPHLCEHGRCAVQSLRGVVEASQEPFDPSQELLEKGFLQNLRNNTSSSKNSPASPSEGPSPSLPSGSGDF